MGRESGKKVRIPLNFSECTNQTFKYSNYHVTSMFGIQKYMCINDNNYTLQGDFYSEVFKYVES